MKHSDVEKISKLYESIQTGGTILREMADAAAGGQGKPLPQIPGWQLEDVGGDIHVLHEETGLNLQFTRNGELNNTNGPAVWYTGPDEGLIEIYFVDGKKHRDDGPAVLLKNGYEEYYLMDKLLSKQEFDNMMVHRQMRDEIRQTVPDGDILADIGDEF